VIPMLRLDAQALRRIWWRRVQEPGPTWPVHHWQRPGAARLRYENALKKWLALAPLLAVAVLAQTPVAKLTLTWQRVADAQGYNVRHWVSGYSIDDQLSWPLVVSNRQTNRVTFNVSAEGFYCVSWTNSTLGENLSGISPVAAYYQ
jgi:hypothetical protein